MSAYIAYQGVDVLYTNTYVVYTNPNCVDDTIKDVLEKYITPENIVHNVIITDLAPSKEYYEELLENPQIKFVYLFDHHKTNESLNGLTPTTFVSEKNETGKAVSATEIIYNYMNKANPSLFNPGVKDYVDLVTSYDTWEWKKSNNQKAKYLSDIFHIIGLENFLDNNLPDDVDILISKYKPVLQYQENSTKCEFEKCNRDLITIATEEYNVGVIFTLTPYISQVCDLILDTHPEIKVMLAFNLPNGCSIRTRDPQIDASELARKLSTGGGHPQAAGMSAKPFLDPLISELTKRLEETTKPINTNLF